MNMIFSHNQSARQQGYIALTSVVVISALLLSLTATMSLAGFSSRFNVLDSEFKTMSNFLASACVDTAILKLIDNLSYAGGETITVDTGQTCEIVSVDDTGPTEKTILTHAEFRRAHTNLEVVVEM